MIVDKFYKGNTEGSRIYVGSTLSYANYTKTGLVVDLNAADGLVNTNQLIDRQNGLVLYTASPPVYDATEKAIETDSPSNKYWTIDNQIVLNEVETTPVSYEIYMRFLGYSGNYAGIWNMDGGGGGFNGGGLFSGTTPAANPIRGGFGGDGATQYEYTSATDGIYPFTSLTTWTDYKHFVYTYDGTNAIKVYMDGVLLGTTTGAVRTKQYSKPMYLGSRAASLTDYDMSMKVKVARYYQYPLTQDEVVQNYLHCTLT